MKNILLLGLFLSLTTACSHLDRKIITDSDKLVTKQIGDYTCWAAVQEGLTAYHGERISQMEILRGYWKAKRFYDLNDETFEFLKNTPEFSIPAGWVSNAISVKTPISKNAIEMEIDSDNPVVSLANNHVTIIVGYTKNEYYVSDPWVGKIVKRNKNEFVSLDKYHKEDAARFYTIYNRKDPSAVAYDERISRDVPSRR